jgi:hypothetical protein
VRVTFSAPLWRWEARDDLWVFVSLPPEVSQEIADVPRPASGFGAVPVRVRCGTSDWRTSIFPGGDDGGYVLPVKKAVRTAQTLGLGDEAEFSLEVLG